MDCNPQYRFTLTRDWIGDGGLVSWIMLNPSTADENVEDPTIRKVIGFSKRWGYSGIIVTNLFAMRATDPKHLHKTLAAGNWEYAVGPGNDDAIANAAEKSDLHVVAWGANASNPQIQIRVREVMRMFAVPSCIGVTKGGHPLHPCMAPYTDAPIPFRFAGRGI